MRLMIGLALAVLVNLGLFTLMQMMTSAKSIEQQWTEDVRLLDFVRLKRETVVDTKKRELPDKPPPPKKPPPPPEAMPQVQKPKAPPPKMAVPKIDLPLNIAGGPYLGEFAAAPVAPPMPNAMPQYDDVMPLVRIPPRYPRSAARRNIEGVVKIAFTITKDGRVRDPYVLSANPKGVFDKAALKAIMKWKFRPKVIDGQPVEQSAAQEIEFKLAK